MEHIGPRWGKTLIGLESGWGVLSHCHCVDSLWSAVDHVVLGKMVRKEVRRGRG